MAVSEKTNEIMGVFVCDIEKKGETVDINRISDEGIRDIVTFFRHKTSPIDEFDKCDASVLVHLWDVAVHKNYRRRGLGFTLFGAVIALAEELGFKAFINNWRRNFKFLTTLIC